MENCICSIFKSTFKYHRYERFLYYDVYYLFNPDVVQYEAKIELPDDFYERSNLSISDRISDLINKVADVSQMLLFRKQLS